MKKKEVGPSDKIGVLPGSRDGQLRELSGHFCGCRKGKKGALKKKYWKAFNLSGAYNLGERTGNR